MKAERNKAEEIAKREAGLAVDILKMYSIANTLPQQHIGFDLNFRSIYQEKSKFLSENLNDESGMCINLRFNNANIDFSKEEITKANINALGSFSAFIKNKKDDEVYNLIIQAIGMFGNALSIKDLHLRVVQLFTVVESLVLKDDEEWKMVKITKDRMSKMMVKEISERERIKIIIEELYQVRHKMIHKAKRLPIDLVMLREFQFHVINLLLKMIYLNSFFKEKDSLIDSVDQNL